MSSLQVSEDGNFNLSSRDHVLLPQVSEDGNVTISSLSLSVPRSSEPLVVVCTAHNPQLPHSGAVSDAARLDVHCEYMPGTLWVPGIYIVGAESTACLCECSVSARHACKLYRLALHCECKQRANTSIPKYAVSTDYIVRSPVSTVNANPSRLDSGHLL